MKLNYDIFASVMEYLYRNNLLYMMCTCCTLFSLGTPLFLREMDIIFPWIDTPRFKLYRALLLANPPRFSNVASLTSSSLMFPDDPGEDYPFRLMAQCRFFPPQYQFPNSLQHFTHLQALDMDMAEREITPSFHSWILSLAQLRELRLRDVGKESLPLDNLLKSLQSRIEAVHLSRTTSHVADSSVEPVIALQNVARTLTALTVEWHDLYDGSRIPHLHPTIRFVNVRALTWVSAIAVEAAPLAWAFPWLRAPRIGNV